MPGLALLNAPSILLAAEDGGGGGMHFPPIDHIVKWPAWFGLAFLLFWEGVLGRVPGFLGRLTLSTHVRGLANLPPTEGQFAAAWTAPAFAPVRGSVCRSRRSPSSSPCSA